MTHQKSENRVVPKGSRKVSRIHPIKVGGGKAIPVEEQTGQLKVPFATAENPEGIECVGISNRFDKETQSVPKAKVKEEKVTSATLEEVTKRLNGSFKKVASNRGAPGPDRQSIEEVREHLSEIVPKLTEELLKGEYKPGAIRRVNIPKAGGGERGLGIPNVVDRMVQEAVRQVLEPQYEPEFQSSSHGFRPCRSCHTAITEAKQHVKDGYEWVVDLDMEKFFDRVCHQRLMSKLAERVSDKGLLKLIGQMLKAKVIMPNGVLVNTEEGVPQGGPLSPLLSNIVLDELDKELESRGHRYTRYADDVNIYVRSERAGQRVMSSLTRFIEKRLRLKVNASKSAVSRPKERHFLGFRLMRNRKSGEVEVGLSKRSKERLAQRIVELTSRNWGNTIESCIKQVNTYLRGWYNFFGICTRDMKETLRNADAHIRRRLRAIQLKQWKRKRTIAKKLISLGVNRKTAWRRVYAGNKSLWALSRDIAVQKGLGNAHYVKLGLYSLLEKWESRQGVTVAPEQLSLFSMLPGY